jgi:5-methyltetrahydrofolate--homocysteine methyltransferase
MLSMREKRERHLRFWQPLEKGEGGYLGVTAPIDDSGQLPVKMDPPRDLSEKWLSNEYALARVEADARNIYWGQDAIHNVFVNFGPGVHAALVGAPYALHKDSIWYDLNPPIKDWQTRPVLKTNQEHELYKLIESRTRALCAAAQGRYAVSFTDIGGQYDVLFSLRGEELLADMLEYPEIVQAAEAELDDAFIAYFNDLKAIIGPSGCGYSGWIPMVHNQPWYPLQCDLSVMISPRMFEQFVLPSLDKVSTAIGQSIYHLDGPEEIKHLPMILALPHVHAIQWVPLPKVNPDGRGAPIQQFADDLSLAMYRQVQAAGKKIVLLGVEPRQVPLVFDAISCDGVYIQTSCKTRREADDLIALARTRWVR